jgi:hypothetical protein
VCETRDAGALAATIRRYFASEMYRTLESRRPAIQAFAAEQYSWSKVASITLGVYRSLLATSQLVGGRKA